MGTTITLTGIDEALSNLGYQNPEALKYRLAHTVRACYHNDDSLLSLQKIDADDLIKTLWETGDDSAAIKARRKNLSSTKSAVNNDLKRLYREGGNPEGIIIGRDNVFVMSDEAKDRILTDLPPQAAKERAASLERIAQSLSTIKDLLGGTDALKDGFGNADSDALEGLRRTIQDLAQQVGIGGSAGAVGSTAGRGANAGPTGEGAGAIHPGGPVLEAGEGDMPPVAAAEGTLSEAADLDVVVEEIEAEDLEEPPRDETETVDEIEPAAEEEVVDEDHVLEEQDVEDLEEILQVMDDTPSQALDALSDEPYEVVDDDDLEEILEALDDTESLEETEVQPEWEEEETQGGAEPLPQAPGLLSEGVGEAPDGGQAIDKARQLAEAFDGHLGTADRFYNQFLLIPAGEYVIGSSNGDRDTQGTRKVRIDAFYLGKFPVTNALFEIFVEKTGYVTRAEKTGHGMVYSGRLRKEVDPQTGLVRFNSFATIQSQTVPGACWYQPLGPGSNLHRKRNHPVVQVTLEDAMAFAAWTGKRLPTEQEWEAAARTMRGYLLPWGNAWRENACNTEETAVAETTPVDRFEGSENELGLTDLLGNILEWTCDIWQNDRGDSNGKARVVKGGSWVSDKEVRLFSRFKMPLETASNILGFRCVAC